MTQPPDSVKAQIPALLPIRAQLRHTLRRQRHDIPLPVKQDWDRLIAHHLLQEIRQFAPKQIGIYWPIKQEPELQDCFQQLHIAGYQLALPIVVSKVEALKFVAWVPGDAMEQDEYGIPIPQRREQAIQPDLIIIPCVGFNSACYRLGYGGGFYDRTLAKFPSVRSIGVAYQLLETNFIAEEFDLPLNAIITEQGITARRI
ncbi:5-formyltetrahydrofolate cyclo-ligase [Undibacterium fentianense]|uniref:5-formyltetrahydrofolate cyclo-ligase n=1 Tax=Undibacterium fentianense TaxID=2828728 RepID=A0A941E4V9_9BURK|nr:5-formyltetrahydrofolate cyclo-ligase [Undibacterium fentianense]MBR7800996.1 5-formyltetrahydrofolate cyclo-ligase [Undibacterium fentianense]